MANLSVSGNLLVQNRNVLDEIDSLNNPNTSPHFNMLDGSARYKRTPCTIETKPKTWNKYVSGDHVVRIGKHIYYFNGSTTNGRLELVNGEWVAKTWNASDSNLIPSDGRCIWQACGYVFYSSGSTQSMLNEATDTWEAVTWVVNPDFSTPISFNGFNIWSDDRSIWLTDSNYVSYRLNRLPGSTSTGYGNFVSVGGVHFPTGIQGQNIWSNGTSCYYTSSTGAYEYKFSKHDWEEISWTYDSSSTTATLTPSNIFKIGNNYYYYQSDYIYLIDFKLYKITRIDIQKRDAIYPLTYLYTITGENLWSDGEHLYHTINGAIGGGASSFEIITHAETEGNKSIFPVDSIYMSMSSTNPSTYFGGTWVQIGQGRVLIGAGTGTDGNNTSQTFTAGGTGGEYTHTLSTGEMPSHSHSVTDPGHNHGITDPGHTHGLRSATTNNGQQGVDYSTKASNGETRTTLSRTTGITINSKVTGITINNSGDGGAHNNVQPYLVCYIWQRTA